MSWGGRQTSQEYARLRNGYVVHGLSPEFAARQELRYMEIMAAVGCRKCGAAKGEDCRTEARNIATQAHWARTEDWRMSLLGELGASPSVAERGTLMMG